MKDKVNIISLWMIRSESSTHHANIGGIAIVEPVSLSRSEITESIIDRLCDSPIFRRVLHRPALGLRNASWRQLDEFDARAHVHFRPLGGDRGIDDVFGAAALVLGRRMDLSRPAWDVTVFEGMRQEDDIPAGSLVVLLRVHHAALDGLGTELFLARLTDQITEALAAGGARTSTRPGRAKSPRDRVHSGDDQHVSDDHPRLELAPSTVFDGSDGSGQVIVSSAHPLAQAQAVRGLAAGSTLNDVLTATIAGAMRRYLSDEDGLPDKDLIGSVPVGGEVSESEPTLRQALFVNLRTTLADPVDRLTAITAETSRKKKLIGRETRRPSGITAAIQNRVQYLPPILFNPLALMERRWTRNRPRFRFFNTVISNIGLHHEGLTFHGSRLIRFYALTGNPPRIGITHSVTAAANTMYITVTADSASLRRPGDYRQALVSSFDELVTAAQAADTGKARPVTAPATPSQRPATSFR